MALLTRRPRSGHDLVSHPCCSWGGPAADLNRGDPSRRVGRVLPELEAGWTLAPSLPNLKNRAGAGPVHRPLGAGDAGEAEDAQRAAAQAYPREEAGAAAHRTVGGCQLARAIEWQAVIEAETGKKEAQENSEGIKLRFERS